MKKQLLTALLTLGGLSAFAQAEFDALRLNQTDIAGTARYVAMSGAFGALGGDMSAINLNPAGIGVYRSSEFSFTPSFQMDATKTDFKQTSGASSIGNASKTKLLVNGFGYVGSFRTYDESAISNFNFGITYNRVADYNNNTHVVGLDRQTSLLDKVCDVENKMWYDDGTHPDHTNFYKYMNGVHVIGLNTANDAYIPRLSGGELTNSDMNLEESGGIDAWNFTLGANYNHSLYIGIGLGIQNVLYERTSKYTESYQFNGGTEFRNALTTSGAGFDFKAGLIYRPVPELRLGISYKTGTYFALTDVFNASMTSWGFRDPITDVLYNPDPVVVGTEQSVDYLLETPWQMTLSAAYQIQDKGMVSMDFDYVDSRNTTLKNNMGYEMTDINDYMAYDFRENYRFRVGAEWRLTDNFSVRGGGAYYMSPLISNLETFDIATAYTRPEYSMLKYTVYSSAGVGYRSGAFFLDAALQNRFNNEHFYNYCDLFDNTDVKYAQVNRNKTNLVLTTGFKF
jgi:long-subunit fatty acid transport protein